ncbi:MAG: oligoendopeptidase F, partial [Ancylomarina sp.]
MFADFEYQAHTMVEQDKPVNADIFAKLWGDIAQKYYGDVSEKTKYSNYPWTRIPHFYNSPY